MKKFQFPQISHRFPTYVSHFLSLMLWMVIVEIILGNIFVDLFRGDSTSRTDNIIISSPRKTGNVQDTIDVWEHIVQVLPHYRYGYLALAKEYYELDEKKEAQDLLEKAFVLNPVDPLVATLSQTIR